jgi:predicted DNA binding protein
MSVIAEVRFAHERGALAHTLETHPDTEIRLIRETSTEPGQTTYFLQVDTDRHEAVRSALEADHTVRRVVSGPDAVEETRWSIEFADAAELLNPIVTREDGVVLNASSATTAGGRRGWHEYWFLPDREAIHTIWQHARAADFEFEVLEFRQREGPLSDRTLTETLTEEQLAALTLAYERGYFEEPRQTSLEALADLLDLSPSAVGGRLKRGMGVLIEEAYLDHDGQA